MFSSPKSQHEVRIIGTGIRHGGLTKMWGSAVSPGLGRAGGSVMIHKFLATLSFFYAALLRRHLFRLSFYKAQRTCPTRCTLEKSGFRTSAYAFTSLRWNKQRDSFFIHFDVLLTVHLSIFISVFNQPDAQNLFHSKFYFMPLHVLTSWWWAPVLETCRGVK